MRIDAGLDTTTTDWQMMSGKLGMTLLPMRLSAAIYALVKGEARVVRNTERLCLCQPDEEANEEGEHDEQARI